MTTISVDYKKLDSVIAGLLNSGEDIIFAAKEAVSTVSISAERQSIDGVIAEVSLSSSYVSDRIYITDVIVYGQSVRAEVIGRYRATRLATYMHTISSIK